MSVIAAGQVGMLVHLLKSEILADQLGNDHKSVHRMSTWLFEVALLTPTSDLSFAALQVITDLLSQQNHIAATAIIDHLPTLLLKLGARTEIIDDCFRGARIVCPVKANRSKDRSGSGNIRQGERKRAIERLVQVLDLVDR